VPGKWVLAGEHAVLEGQPALALPHPDLFLDLEFQPSGAELWTEPGLRACLEGLGPLPAGSLRVRSTIPQGAGLGSSAALCVALARWVGNWKGLAESAQLAWARSLEDRFHGQSSGMDVATVFHGSPLLFERDPGARPPFRVTRLEVSALPAFSFHDTGLRASTRECVAQVRAWRERAPEARAWDEQMGRAARTGAAALVELAQGRFAALDGVAQAMNDAQACMRAWGLIPDEIARQEALLRREGALAVKLTGSGGGGFLVALRSGT
jgi:mevalonate kinase